jgi:hypothetical protein
VIEFSGFGKFARHLGRLAVMGEEVTHHVTEESAKLILERAKAKIGDYQPASGAFNAWPELADSTKDEKERLGYVGGGGDYYQPLLREGVMRDSYEERTHGNESVIGSTDDVALYQEAGTPTTPPRPVLGPAAYDSKHDIGDKAAGTVVAWISGVGWKRPRQLIKLP